jgi:hypothetical protein
LPRFRSCNLLPIFEDSDRFPFGLQFRGDLLRHQRDENMVMDRAAFSRASLGITITFFDPTAAGDVGAAQTPERRMSDAFSRTYNEDPLKITTRGTTSRPRRHQCQQGVRL